MATRKLYYEDCHLYRFAATVTGCEKSGDNWAVTLSATAFYPEGGGQPCDIGTLGGVTVLDVQELGEEVVHTCAAPLEVGADVEGSIDENRRFTLMQQHSGEHILSGIVNRRFGYHNTGFHMGSEIITIDFDGVIPSEEVPAIEAEANRAVWANIPIECFYPSPEELPNTFYRTKKALPWPVRIVRIPGYDSCACCGVHVAATGEIGLIKIFSIMNFRGGSRLEIACGGAALALLNEAFTQNRLVSQAFSAKWPETGAAAQRMNEALEEVKFAANGLRKQLFGCIAENYVNHDNVVHFENDLDSVQIRELADVIAGKCSGFSAVFSGNDREGYGYCLATRQGDLRQLCHDMNLALKGRGGGKPNFHQGRVSADRKEIEAFWKGR